LKVLGHVPVHKVPIPRRPAVHALGIFKGLKEVVLHAVGALHWRSVIMTAVEASDLTAGALVDDLGANGAGEGRCSHVDRRIRTGYSAFSAQAD